LLLAGLLDLFGGFPRWRGAGWRPGLSRRWGGINPLADGGVAFDRVKQLLALLGVGLGRRQRRGPKRAGRSSGGSLLAAAMRFITWRYSLSWLHAPPRPGGAHAGVWS